MKKAQQNWWWIKMEDKIKVTYPDGTIEELDINEAKEIAREFFDQMVDALYQLPCSPSEFMGVSSEWFVVSRQIVRALLEETK
jgi:hypothetical protein